LTTINSNWFLFELEFRFKALTRPSWKDGEKPEWKNTLSLFKNLSPIPQKISNDGFLVFYTNESVNKFTDGLE